MTNREIIKQLAKDSHKKAYWYTFSRYIILLDNYLDGKTLSVMEKTNHPHNEPRAYYLKELATGFGIEVDLDSSLWEGRMSKTMRLMLYKNDFWSYSRFFQRLEHFRKNKLPINSDTLGQMVKSGSLWFNKEYNYDKE